MRQSRQEKNAETRQKLIIAARKAFGTTGYAASSMDDFTAEVGLTRGALYHQFGDKQGLFRAVLAEVDAEMAVRLKEIANRAPNRWQSVIDEWTAFIEMALEPEIQRIMFRDGPAVLGDFSQWAGNDGCVMALKDSLDVLQAEGQLVQGDTEAMARLINGAASHAATWIAGSDAPGDTSRKAVASFCSLLQGLRVVVSFPNG